MASKDQRNPPAEAGVHAGDEWEQTFNGISDLVAVLDTQHRIRRANRALASRVGMSPEECLGLSCCRMLHGTEESVENCPLALLEADQKEHSAEVHDPRTNSDYLVTVSPLFDEHDQLSGSVHVARDITLQKRAESALRQSVSLLRATLDSTADGILVVDLNGGIVDFNGQFANLWRIPRDILDSRDDRRALSYVLDQLKYPEQFISKVQELYAHPEADSFDLLEFRDGRSFERYSRTQRIGGLPIGRVWSFRDVSDRREAEDSLYRQMAFDAMATKFLARSARGNDLEIDGHIRTSLEELGFFTEVDEAYVIRYTANTWSVSHFWHAPGVPGQIQNYHNIPLGISRWMESRLQDGKVVQLHTLDDLPPEASEERERLSRDGVVSLLLIPLRGKDGVVRGSFGLRSYSRQIQWTPEDVQRMRLLGDAIATTLERRRAESAQHESEARLRSILEAVQTGVIIIDPESYTVADVNTMAASLIGAPKEAIIGSDYHRFHAPAREPLVPAAEPDAAARHIEDTLVKADGTHLPVLKTVVPVMLDERRHILETVVDISALKQMESQVAQSQKMDAIGRLAGGVAHDFNNIVQVILGFTDIVLMDMAADHPHRPDLDEIKNAAMRASELSRRLLSFSRRQPVSPTLLDLSAVAGETLKMLHNLLGADIQVASRFEPELRRISADAGQISQVVMNLAVNARDAMPHGGQLTIRTANITILPHDIAMLAMPTAQPGDFVCLTVSDNGTGMNDEVRTHLFEPFFTTKESGKGTGLGLSVVYGIVKQCEGWIHVDTRPGVGTAFKLYFPAAAGSAGAAECSGERDVAPALRGNGERILLVEDDPGVCNLAAKTLQAANYIVRACSSAREALALFQEKDRKFDLLFSDVVLPDCNGIALADDIRALTPQLPVLLCSAYTDERSRLATINAKGYHFLQKPYSSTGLLHIIRVLLDTPQPSEPEDPSRL